MNKIAYNEIEVAVFISMVPEGKGLPGEGARKGETAEGRSVRHALFPGFAVNNCRTVIPQVMESYREKDEKTHIHGRLWVDRFFISQNTVPGFRGNMQP